MSENRSAQGPHVARFRRSVMEAVHHACDVVYEDQHGDPESGEAEAVRYFTRLLAQGSLVSENFDPAYPQFARICTPWMPITSPNPDYTYLIAPMDGRYTYQVSGTRGTCRFLALETHVGSVLRLFRPEGRPATLIDFREHGGDLSVTASGDVEVTVGGDDPGDGHNWLPLAPGSGFLIARYGYYDWGGEEAPQLTIERIGATYPAPARTAAALEAQVRAFSDFLEFNPADFAAMTQRYYDGSPNEIVFPPIEGNLRRHDSSDTSFAAFRDQYYGRGRFAITDEVVSLVTLDISESRYWGAQVTSRFRESLDWHQRTTSINGHQATIDDDGKFRAVISNSDPGVPNWLDPGGLASGFLWIRVLGSTHPPTGTVERVPLSELRSHLPENTALITPADRSDLVRARNLACQRRGDLM